MIKKINELELCISLRDLQHAGIIPWTLVRDRDIYLEWDLLVRQGMEIGMADRKIARKYGCAVKTVRRAVKTMKSE